MSDTRAAFLAAIRTNPDADLPRLVYADWLDENGEPERAGFVRRSVEAGRLKRELHCHHQDPENRPRCRACVARLGLRGTWSGITLPPEACCFAEPDLYDDDEYEDTAVLLLIDRGFITSTTITFASWLTHAPAILAESVRLTVRLTDRPYFELRYFAPDGTQLSGVITPSNVVPGYYRAYRLGGDSCKDWHRVPQGGEIVWEVLKQRWPEVAAWEFPPEPTGGLIVPRSFLRDLAERNPQAAADLVATQNVSVYGE